MKPRNIVLKYGRKLALVGTGLAVSASSAFAALPADVDTALTASQTDVLAMIGKGFLYLGSITAAMVVLMVFVKILRKGKG